MMIEIDILQDLRLFFELLAFYYNLNLYEGIIKFIELNLKKYHKKIKKKYLLLE